MIRTKTAFIITFLVLMVGSAILSGCSSVSGDPKVAVADNVRYQPVELVEEQKKPPEISAFTYYTSGLILEKQGRLKEAARQYELAIRKDPKFVDAYNHLGIIFSRLSNYSAAEAALKKAVSIAPNRADIHNNLGFVYLFMKKYKFAEAEFRNALALNPDYSRAKANLAISLVYQGRLDEAASTFLSVSSAAQANYNIALILQSEGRLALAEKYYKASLQYDPEFVPAKKALNAIKEMKISRKDLLRPSSKDSLPPFLLLEFKDRVYSVDSSP